MPIQREHNHYSRDGKLHTAGAIASVLSPTSITLLRAATLSGPAAAEAWRAWQAVADLEHLPPEQFSLLPLAYRTAEQADPNHPWLPRLRGIYRRAWYANQLALHTLRTTLDALAADGVPALVAGDAVLTLAVYPDAGARPIRAPEMIVPASAARAAIDCIARLGWRPAPPAPHLDAPAYRAWVPGHRFTNDLRQALRLDWHVSPDAPSDAADADGWSHAHSLAIEDAPAQCLDETAHLLRACLAVPDQGLPALADAAVLIRSDAIDWPRFTQLAAQHNLALPALFTLQQLGAHLDIDVPPNVTAALRQSPTPAYQRCADEAARVASESRSIAQRGWLRYARFRWTAAAARRRASPLTFIAYQQHTRDLKSAWQLPMVFMRRLTGRHP